MTVEHVPVMLNEVLRSLTMLHGKLEYMVDATLGLGGYSEALLREFSDIKILYGIDQDREAISRAVTRLAPFADKFLALEGNFSEIGALLLKAGRDSVNAVVFDLGISNMQISIPDRGFSFRGNGPLDMRMDGGSSGGKNASDIVNSLDASALANIFRQYGEEKFSWPIAKGIEKYRVEIGPIDDTDTLVAIIRDVLPAPVMRKSKGHPARKVFQALRIYVNDEMGVLDRGLDQAINVLAPGGMIVVVDYHSLEDRMVKWRFRKWKDEGLGEILTRKALLPTEEEVESNPKSRSAKLRVFMKHDPLAPKDTEYEKMSYKERRRLKRKLFSR